MKARNLFAVIALLAAFVVVATLKIPLAEAVERTFGPSLEAPTPRVASLASFAQETDSTVSLGTRIVGLKGTIPGDSLYFRYWSGTTLKTTSRRPITAVSDGPRTYPLGAYGSTITFKGCVDVKRSGALLSVGCWTRAVTREAPVPSADSIVQISAVAAYALLDALPPPPCPAGHSCATQYAPPPPVRFHLTRLEDRDSLLPVNMSCGRDPETLDAKGLVYLGCTAWADAKRLGMRVCVVGIRADGNVVWSSSSSGISVCHGEPESIFATRYGAKWRPDLPAAPSVTFRTWRSGREILVEALEPTFGLSLSFRAI